MPEREYQMPCGSAMNSVVGNDHDDGISGSVVKQLADCCWAAGIEERACNRRTSWCTAPVYPRAASRLRKQQQQRYHWQDDRCLWTVLSSLGVRLPADRLLYGLAVSEAHVVKDSHWRINAVIYRCALPSPILQPAILQVPHLCTYCQL